ncbi:MAG: ABC transporter permease [Lachnospiraceae bacterium]|nr:ABC transporter permease [Lachnospiraceae bacterium]
MLLFENFLLALSGLRANKMRSILTMLGIIIGIASVIAIMTVGNSMSGSITASMSNMGASNITVGLSQISTSTEVTQSGMRFNRGPRYTQYSDDDLITEEMLNELQKTYPEDVTGFLLDKSVGSAQAKDGQLYANISITGANQTSIENDDLTILAGRLFTDRDQDEAKKVCIVSDYFCNNLFNGNVDAALGKEISVLLSGKYCHYTVVGVYEYDASSNFSSSSEEDTSTTLYIPLLTAFNQVHEDPAYSQLTLTSSATTDVNTFMSTVEDFFNSKYYRKNESFEVSCSSLTSLLEEMTSMMSTISLAISFIAGISLLVGGIGVMNIMLVSIQERTKEIGTRKALGATNASIRTQFIVEAIVLCLVGGFLGIAIGCAIGVFAAHQMGYDAYPSMGGIIFSVVFSMAIGVFFGYYPANKAAKMNPVEALRYE